MEITAKQVKELREATGAGIMDSKKALEESQGDVEKAVRILREKGLAGAQKKMGRVASEGIVDAYIHLNNRIGVLLEVNCETDFVARNETFRCMVHDIALHIAASSPLYVSPEDIPENILEVEKEINRARAIKEGKPEQVVDKIVEGRLKKFYEEVCLLDQPFIRDPETTIGELVRETIAAVGENIVVRRFSRFQIGEALPE
ncbi:MAG: translation elongation factor Ts [Candidatus Solincola sediminis]|uniref:Elongation factor Ts n=1 Tax=Candidatus Solincola sediminis TaxID=1797199 RepID=A0A1F2WFQ2_9ACTN|nr:MAG: translation elongation factor Ts [Candidatus Solincola sediminis]OFW59980.1 MAG: translation elongation factor Ts [Candidatus Solincola sediminis]